MTPTPPLRTYLVDVAPEGALCACGRPADVVVPMDDGEFSYCWGDWEDITITLRRQGHAVENTPAARDARWCAEMPWLCPGEPAGPEQIKVLSRREFPGWSIIHSTRDRWWATRNPVINPRTGQVIGFHCTALDADTPEELREHLRFATTMEAPTVEPKTTWLGPGA